jgi:hypothetical protein
MEASRTTNQNLLQLSPIVNRAQNTQRNPLNTNLSSLTTTDSKEKIVTTYTLCIQLTLEKKIRSPRRFMPVAPRDRNEYIHHL